MLRASLRVGMTRLTECLPTVEWRTGPVDGRGSATAPIVTIASLLSERAAAVTREPARHRAQF